VLAVTNDGRTPADDWAAREELRFCLGGKVVRRYTAGALVALGADDAAGRPGGVAPVGGNHSAYSHHVLGVSQTVTLARRPGPVAKWGLSSA